MTQRPTQSEVFMRAVAQYMSDPDVRDEDNHPVVPGLDDLVEVLSMMAAAPPGARPRLNQDHIERINNSPLHPVLKQLQPIYKKLGPLEGSPEHLQAQAQAQIVQRMETLLASPQSESAPGPGPSSARPRPPQIASVPGPGPSSAPGPGPSPAQQPPSTPAPDVDRIKNVEASLSALTSNLNLVAQAVLDVTTRGEMGGNFQTLENNLRRADSETRDTVKASVDAAKTQVDNVDKKISRMTDKVDPMLTELAQGIKKLQVGLLGDVKAERTRLETKVNELEKEVKQLQQVIDTTKAELLPVEIASEIALRGTFSDETGKVDGRRGSNSATVSLPQTAKRVRTNAFNSKLRKAVEEKEETAQKLQFVGFVIDQVRQSDSTQLFTQDLSRLTPQPTAGSKGVAASEAVLTSSKPSATRTGVAPSQACSRPSDLHDWESDGE
ncbi:hypothetical protein FRC00_000492 [Tulasnella sp. 408]|nr:hypothetical protein FRC00_000492 [Tulasnella sp. 408]